MQVSTSILLLLVVGVLSQKPGGPEQVAVKQADPSAGYQHAGQPQGQGQPGVPTTTDPSAANPWHELLHKMMDLMTAAASGGPLPGEPGAPSAGGPVDHHKAPVDNKQSKVINYQPEPAGPTNPAPVPTQPAQPNLPPSQPGPPQNQPGQPQNQPGQPPRQPGQPPKPPGPRQPGPQQPPKPQQPQVQPRPAVPDCFWEGKFYRPSSDILRGQHDRWCYVTYCDSNGKVQFWDDYNCPPNSMKPTSTHSAGSNRPGPNGGKKGCYHKGTFYEPGQEINQHTVGQRCYGTYCSHESQVVQWEDWCSSGTTSAPAQAPVQIPHAPPKPKRAGGGGGGKRKGGKGGKKRGGGGGGGGRARQEREGPRPGGGRGAGRRRGGAGSIQGCYHNQLYYQPNEDVIVGNIGDMCYGYYCEGNNVFVHWEDRCTPTTPPAPTTLPTGNYFF